MVQFKKLLNSKDFVISFELVPPRKKDLSYEQIFSFVYANSKDKLIDCFSITENPGGNPKLATFLLAKELLEFEVVPIIHFSGKDKNRNQIESELWAYENLDLRNLLILSGDYPKGQAKPVFDLDSVLILKYLQDLGLADSFWKGVVVNPFKLSSNELWWQYVKLYRKLKAGADYVITQSGFSFVNWLELKNVLKQGLTQTISAGLKDQSLTQQEEDQRFEQTPLLASLVYPSPGLVKLLLELKIPGILANKRLVEIVKTKDKDLPLKFCARLAMGLKQIGYKGIHLCSFPLNYAKIEKFFKYCLEYENNWEEFIADYSNDVIFVDPQTNTLKTQKLASLYNSSQSSDLSLLKPLKVSPSWHYVFSQIFHVVFFAPQRPWFKMWIKLAKWLDKRPWLKKIFVNLEYVLKHILYDCEQCGDCVLAELSYLCPRSGCAKGLVNGPCGGSTLGKCEVYPDQTCFYVKVLQNTPDLKSAKRLIFPHRIIPARDWSKNKKSSWLNFYLTFKL